MSEPFLSEIRIMSFNFAPKGWAMCNGQLMPINQNQALFSLLGTNYGGDGRVNFALPDLRGRVPIHFQNNAFTLGTRGGEQAHTLSIAELPQHVHTLNVNTGAGNAASPAGAILAKASANTYGPASPLVALNPAASLNTGGSQAHLNMQPYLTLTFCISLQGLFPTQN
jgi:microcystin-dependent protein